MGRRWAVLWTAWGLRRGLTEDEAVSLMRRSFPWRGWPWREQVLIDARRRNQERRA